MVVGKDTVVNQFSIYSPRWHDRVVLLAKFKAGRHNVITFPKAKTLPGQYYISGEDMAKCPVEKLPTRAGGQMDVYAVPLDSLHRFEREV